MKDYIDPLELQRLLDGRMCEYERTLFLECVDEHPHHWRSIALAFVEEQLLRELLTNDHEAVDVALPAKPLSTPEDTRRPRNHMLRNLLLQAAVLLLVLGGGATVGWIANGMATGAQPDDYYVLVTPTDAATTEVDGNIDRGGGSAQPAGPAVPPDDDRRWEQLFREHGIDVSEDPVVYVIQDGEGGHYVIPQRRVTLVSNKN